jgi:hypothetical protein
MNRREFLKKSSLFLSGAVIAGSGILNKKAFADIAGNTVFSLDVATDKPELAIQKIDPLIRSFFLNNHRIDFMQYELSGNHTGDIAFVKSGQLIDFYRADDWFSNRLRETAKALSLPRSLENPTLLRFFSGSGGAAAKNVNIFSGNVLVRQLSIKNNTSAHRVTGENGHIDVAVTDGAVKIVSASCKHKTCMELGAISRPGQSLVCIPNRLRVVVEGGSNFGVDGITF